LLTEVETRAAMIATRLVTGGVLKLATEVRCAEL